VVGRNRYAPTHLPLGPVRPNFSLPPVHWLPDSFARLPPSVLRASLTVDTVAGHGPTHSRLSLDIRTWTGDYAGTLRVMGAGWPTHHWHSHNPLTGSPIQDYPTGCRPHYPPPPTLRRLTDALHHATTNALGPRHTRVPFTTGRNAISPATSTTGGTDCGGRQPAPAVNGFRTGLVPRSRLPRGLIRILRVMPDGRTCRFGHYNLLTHDSLPGRPTLLHRYLNFLRHRFELGLYAATKRYLPDCRVHGL